MAAVTMTGYFTWKRSRKTADRLSERGQILLYLRYPDARRIEIAASPGSFQTIRETVLTNPSE
jgi:hypothetical protein